MADAALRDIVIGMSDGLTVPFALAAGLSGAVTSNSLILTAGVAITALALGAFGYPKSRLTGQPPVAGAARMVAVGLLAAGAAYGLARWVGT